MASTAELEAEILADLEENPDAYTAPANDVITIDPETKIINLPSSEVLFGTEEEHGVERKYFKCPRIVGDNIDLFTHQIYISYMAVKDKNATFIPDSIPQSYWCDDVALDETGNYITFSWLLSGNVLASRGFVGFAVIAKSVEGDILKTRWKTAPAVGTVLMTLPDAGEGIAELYPDIITQLLDRMDAVEEITSVELDGTLTDNTKAAPAGVVGELKSDFNKLSEKKIDNPSTGSVGQILEIESVDEKGKPKTYKAVDKPTSSGEVSDEQISSAVSEYMANNPIEESDPTVPEWAKQPTKPTYTAHEVGALPDTTKIPSKTSDLQNDSGFLTQHQDLSGYALKSEIPNVASDIGAESEGTAESKVSSHNVSDTAHNDIRLLVQGLTERLNALADSDDETLDQMSEVVAYIKSNKSLIDAITTSKINVSDIIDNLTTNVSNKPLSAAQGVKLKALIDAITSVELDESLSDNTKAAPAGMVGELKGEIADKATLENGVVKFWKTSAEENRTDTLLYSVDISSIGGTGGLDLENLTLSVSQVGNYQRLSMSDGTTTKNVDIPIITITDEQVQTAVTEYLDANPVQTGATQEEAEQIQKNTNDIAALKGDIANKFTGGELDPNGNLIFETEIEIGVFLDEGNGSKLVNQYTTMYCVTPFIEIEPNISYSTGCLKDGISNGAYSTCFYDADNVFISGLKYKNLLTTPNNAKYIRLCWDGCNDMVGTGAFLLKKSTEIVTAYEAPSYTSIRLVDSDYVTKEVTDNLDERVTVLEGSSGKRYINLASDYYITNGDILELFYRGLLNLGDYKKYNIKIECSVGGYFEKRYIFTPTSSNVGNDYPLTLSLYDDNDKLIESATTTIHCIEKKRNPSNQVNVLCVGDSLTVGGQWVTEFRRLLTADGLSNVNFIGTCGESPSKYEGYGGWSIASYNSSMATNDYMWVNVSSHDKTSSDQHSVYVDSNGTKWKIETIETNRLKMIRTSGSSAIPTSGSLTWESGGDNHSDIVYSSVEQASGNPFWNENINKNDFVTYANQQGVSTIDYCLVLIGWNNSYWNESITKAETNRFINSLQTDFPNCKIILAGLQIPSLDGFGNNYGCDWYWKEKVNFVFNLQKWYEDIASSNDNVIFTQVSGQFDSENNMLMYQRTVNKRNSNKELFGSNGVHPADSGYLQIADVFYRAFESF